MPATQLTISTPPDALWRLVGDLRHWADLLPTVTSVVPLEPGRPEEVGAAYRLEQPGLRPATWTVTEWRPGHGFTWISRAPGVRTTATHELVPVGGPADGAATRLDLSVEWSGPLAPVLRAAYGGRTLGYIEAEAAAFGALATRSAP